jgi:hypothetical protein
VRRALRFVGTWALLMCVVLACVAGTKFVYGQWPSCGPKFTIVEQTLQGQVRFWLRKGRGTWPLCENVLQYGYFDSADEARSAAIKRLRHPDTEERAVGTVE